MSGAGLSARGYRRGLSVPELLEGATILLGGASRRRFHGRRGLGELPVELLARLAGGGGFLVETLGFRSGAALVAGPTDLEYKLVGTAAKSHLIAGAHVLGGLGTLAVHVHLATIHGLRGECARLEEARGPEPFVYADRIGPERSVIGMRGHLNKLTAHIAGGALMAVVAVVALVGVTGCGGDSAVEQQAAERTAIAAGQATASQAAALPATGLWSEAHLMDRLSRTGVLPRAREGTPPATPWMNRAPIALAAGGGEVYVWIYADSTARRAVTDRLDPETGVPPGTTSPFAPPMVFVTNNNLAAIITGGTDSNIERIMLALQAGLPVEP